MTDPLPPVAISMGDPAGVGPEITIAAWKRLQAIGPAFFLIADPVHMAPLAAEASAAARPIESPADAAGLFSDALPVLPLSLAAPVRAGAPDPANAPAVIASIERAVGFALSGEACAVVTNPVSKSSLYAAGFAHPGHTEFVTHLVRGTPFDGPPGPVMMLVARDLRVALVTIHQPLKDAIASLSKARIVEVARVVEDALRRDFGIANPRLAIAGLNPHAGEDGALGREEIDMVAPAIAQLRTEGVNVVGPVSPDSLFHTEARAKYDAAICLYHDQGLIPVKTLDFWGGVNITLGLPVVRTSPDHGTGFSIAGRGEARADSLVAAIRKAHAIALSRRGA